MNDFVDYFIKILEKLPTDLPIIINLYEHENAAENRVNSKMTILAIVVDYLIFKIEMNEYLPDLWLRTKIILADALDGKRALKVMDIVPQNNQKWKYIE